MPTDDTLREMHHQMVRIRIFEETIQKCYFEGKTPAFDIAAGPVPGEMHLAAGQEPVAAGVCAHLRPSDAITAMANQRWRRCAFFSSRTLIPAINKKMTTPIAT